MNKNNEHVSEWLYCPLCQNRSKVKVKPETVLINFPLYCSKCRNVTTMNIVSNKMLVIREPDT